MAQLSFSLKESATIVRLNISFWGGLRHDKEATKEATKHLGMKEKSGRFSKRLIAEERLSEIRKIKDAARKFHTDNTVAWDDNNGRLLKTKNHMTYVTRMQVFEDTYNDICDLFEKDFPGLVEEAKIDLGPRFNGSDYPEDIRSKFSFKVTFSPIATADDFRVQLKDSEIERIKAIAREEEQKSLKAAMDDVWRRLFEVVESLHERTSDKKAIFRDTLISNIKDICEILDRVNITNDPNLEAMRQEVANKFANIDPEALRTDQKFRKNVAQEADEIMAKMAAYYNPASGSAAPSANKAKPAA